MSPEKLMKHLDSAKLFLLCNNPSDHKVNICKLFQINEFVVALRMITWMQCAARSHSCRIMLLDPGELVGLLDQISSCDDMLPATALTDYKNAGK